MSRLWLLLALLGAAGGAQAETSLQKVIDGDTVIIDDDGQRYSLRLLDIDAPERQQAFGNQSRRQLIQLCSHSVISVHTQGQDRYQRTLGHLYCDGVDASAAQVAAGMAWFNHRYSQRTALNTLQQEARDARRGLWQDADPTPPWQWRKRYGQHYRPQE